LRLFLLLVLRQLRLRPVRVLFAIGGVALGISLFVAVTLINRATLDYFRESVTQVAGTAKLAIVGDEMGFPEEVLEKVERVPGVAHAVPSLDIRARYTGADGGEETIVVLGVDLLRETGVRAYRAGDEEIVDDPLAFLNQEDSIILTRAFAAQHGLKKDSKFTLATAAGVKPFTVRGLLTPEGPAKAYGGRLGIMDIDGARVTFGKENLTDRIDIVPKPGVSEAELADRLEKIVGPALKVERPETQVKTFERLVASQQAVLAFTSTLALVIAIFLIGNTMAVAVAERRNDIGVIRAVGGSRARVMSFFLLEAAIVGAIGSAIGVFLGRGLAMRLVGSVSHSLSTQLVMPIEVGDVVLRPNDAIGAMIVGLLASLIAAAWPAWGAARIAPAAALAPHDAVVEKTRGPVLRAITGAVLLALLGVISATGADAKMPELGRLTGALAIFGFALVAPQVAVVLIAGLRAIVARVVPTTAPILRFACENLLAHRRRTAASVLSLVIGLSLVVINATVQESFRHALLDAVDRSLVGDAFVSAKGRFLSATVQPMREEIGKEIEEADGLTARAMRLAFVTYGTSRIAIKAWDPMPRSPFIVTDGMPEALFGSAEPTVLISENFSTHFGKKTGDWLDLSTPSGILHTRVAGIVVDYSSPEGTVFLARDIYKKAWHDALVTVFYVFAPHTDRVDSETLRRRLDERVCGKRGLVVSLVGDVRAATENLLEESFAYSRSIETAALIVGLLGLLNMVFINVLERTRELGMLRAIGMARRQLATMILWETLILGASAGAAAGLLAAYLARVWLGGSLSATLGWAIPIHLPVGALARALGAGVIVGVIAGLAAARRAARRSIPEALANQ
jgi:putative ABC transport system permease protein